MCAMCREDVCSRMHFSTSRHSSPCTKEKCQSISSVQSAHLSLLPPIPMLGYLRREGNHVVFHSARTNFPYSRCQRAGAFLHISRWVRGHFSTWTQPRDQPGAEISQKGLNCWCGDALDPFSASWVPQTTGTNTTSWCAYVYLHGTSVSV